ncbi:MAG TPA: carbon-nitrogen hydrolase family protein [Candidatus Methylomirabilis sp.]|nr:carbon-nitrogen hydrolase family protein [Candidatus Methylomirabilis sp.]
MKFTLALLQIAPLGSDQDKNLEKGIRSCREAKSRGADLAVFPELWSIGFVSCPLDSAGRQAWEARAINQDSRFFQEFVALARDLNLNIAITYLEEHAPKPRNTVSIINARGEVVPNYYNRFICNFGLELLQKPDPNPASLELGCDFNCDPGDTSDVCTLAGKDGNVIVGAMICADREFPEPAADLMTQGAEIIVVPNSCHWDKIRSSLLEARAFENVLAIGMANYPASKANGHSQAYTGVAWNRGIPARTLLVEAGEEEGIAFAEIDVTEIRRFHEEESWRLQHRKNWYESLRAQGNERGS